MEKMYLGRLAAQMAAPGADKRAVAKTLRKWVAWGLVSPRGLTVALDEKCFADGQEAEVLEEAEAGLVQEIEGKLLTVGVAVAEEAQATADEACTCTAGTANSQGAPGMVPVPATGGG